MSFGLGGNMRFAVGLGSPSPLRYAARRPAVERTISFLLYGSD
jgi:hypothetical protein